MCVCVCVCVCGHAAAAYLHACRNRKQKRDEFTLTAAFKGPACSIRWWGGALQPTEHPSSHQNSKNSEATWATGVQVLMSSPYILRTWCELLSLWASTSSGRRRIAPACCQEPGGWDCSTPLKHTKHTKTSLFIHLTFKENTQKRSSKQGRTFVHVMDQTRRLTSVQRGENRHERFSSA